MKDFIPNFTNAPKNSNFFSKGCLLIIQCLFPAFCTLLSIKKQPSFRFPESSHNHSHSFPAPPGHHPVLQNLIPVLAGNFLLHWAYSTTKQTRLLESYSSWRVFKYYLIFRLRNYFFNILNHTYSRSIINDHSLILFFCQFSSYGSLVSWISNRSMVLHQIFMFPIDNSFSSASDGFTWLFFQLLSLSLFFFSILRTTSPKRSKLGSWKNCR
ncbi:MAG: hypothetical protein Ta2E_12820 [Mycoplasmoidaceae bacterium]|nr:MAG: hypothetical protein Ta2E_12820 [Mycoplasmoidaceae bacterium]